MTGWNRSSEFSAMVFSVLALMPLQAGEIAGYNPADPVSHTTYDRFTAGFPSAPVPNLSPTFTGAGYSNTLSGIGYVGGTFSVTLVSERHFIGVAHLGYSPGQQISFVNQAGVITTATVQTTRIPTTTVVNSLGQTQTLTSDLILGTLTAPIPASAGIDHYRIIKSDFTVQPFVQVGSDQVGQPSPPNYYDGKPLLAYGQNPTYSTSPHLGLNNVDHLEPFSFDNLATNATMGFTYAYQPSVPGSFYTIGGDSGSPTFLPYNGELTLLGPHSANSGDIVPGALSYDIMLPYYTDQLNAFMAMDTDATHPTGYALQLIAVPEPALAGLLIVLYATLRRSRKQ